MPACGEQFMRTAFQFSKFEDKNRVIKSGKMFANELAERFTAVRYAHKKGGLNCREAADKIRFLAGKWALAGCVPGGYSLISAPAAATSS